MTTFQLIAKLRKLLKFSSYTVGIGFGFGLVPKAPGTFGTLVALPIYWLMDGLPFATYLILIIMAFIGGICICQYGSNWLEKDDPSTVVWDEIVGYLFTMVVAPPNWQWMLTGFVLFRFFDIIKPWPISYADESLHGGLGIMADDLIAGVFALAIMQCLYFILYI